MADVKTPYDFIHEKLAKIQEESKDNSFKSISDEFIFAYGPYMAMTEDEFEDVVDQIATTSTTMKIMQCGAYLIRMIRKPWITYEKAHKECMKFKDEVQKMWHDQAITETSANALFHFANVCIKALIELRKLNNHNVDDKIDLDSMDSFMTNSAPIVPYGETLRKQDVEPLDQIFKKVDEANEGANSVDIALAGIERENSERVEKLVALSSTVDDSANAILQEMLLNHLFEILTHSNTYTTVVEDNETNQVNMLKLDKFIHNDGNPITLAGGYYFLAILNYYKIPREVFDQYLKFFKKAAQFSTYQSEEEFTKFVNESALDISTVVSNREMEAAVESAYEIEVYKIRPDDRTKAPFNITEFMDYVATHRYMRFDEYTNQFAINKLGSYVNNINYMNDSMIIIELVMGANNEYGDGSRMMVMPFMDFRDCTTKLLVKKNTFKLTDTIYEENIADFAESLFPFKTV